MKEQKTKTAVSGRLENFVSKPTYVYCSSCKFRSMDNFWEHWCYSNALLKRNIFGEYLEPVKCGIKNKRNDCKEYQPRWWKRLFNLFKAC